MISNPKTINLRFENGKTFMSGLNNHIEGPEIKQFIKNLEEKLKSKAMKKKINDDIETYFENDYRNEIKNFILENSSIEENMIDLKEDINIQTTETTDNNIIDIINKKISLHHMKEKRTCRTYITGLKDFLNEEELDATKKKLQKALGTNSNVNENGDYGFNGNYTKDNSKKIIIKNCILECNKSKIKTNLFDF